MIKINWLDMTNIKSDRRPNIFKYAKSELAQDAFICWLIEWARIENKESDPMLHECATSLISSFFTLCQIKKPVKYEHISIHQQDNNIDILCVVNDEFAILIEDKVHTSEHSNQLVTYLMNVESRGKYKKILPIYFKTGDQGNYNNVKNSGFKLFLRENFLKILKNCGSQNEIFTNFYDHLRNIDNRVLSFRNLPLNNWHSDSWIGMFNELKKTYIAGADWGYVPNKNGGFMAMYWQGIALNDILNIYLQIEENKLCIKIGVKEKSKEKESRKKMYELLVVNNEKLGKEKYNIKLQKPERFGTGKHMTIAIVSSHELIEKEYRFADKNGFIDMEKTGQLLQNLSAFIEETTEITRNNQQGWLYRVLTY
jgi:hypothetical protein